VNGASLLAVIISVIQVCYICREYEQNRIEKNRFIILIILALFVLACNAIVLIKSF